MKPYTLEFVKSAINDTEVESEFLVDYVLPLVEDEIGGVTEHRMDFIKKYYTNQDLAQTEKLILDIVEGEVEHFAEMVGIDISDFVDIENNREKWETTDFAPDFEILIQDLNQPKDDEPVDQVDQVSEPVEYKF